MEVGGFVSVGIATGCHRQPRAGNARSQGRARHSQARQCHVQRAVPLDGPALRGGVAGHRHPHGAMGSTWPSGSLPPGWSLLPAASGCAVACGQQRQRPRHPATTVGNSVACLRRRYRQLESGPGVASVRRMLASRIDLPHGRRYRRPLLLAQLLIAPLLVAPRQASADADADDDDAPRPGYHVEYRPRRALLVTGLAVGIPFYALGVLAGSIDGYDNAKAWLYLPVAGPWMTLALRDSGPCNGGTDSSGHCCTEPGCPGSLAKPLLVMDGLGQLSGAVLVTVAYAAAKPRWVPDNHLVIAPFAQPHARGLAISGSW